MMYMIYYILQYIYIQIEVTKYKKWDINTTVKQYLQKLNFHSKMFCQSLWRNDSQFDNISLLNAYSKTVLYQPLINHTKIQPTHEQNNINLMTVFRGGNSCKNALRLLSREGNRDNVGERKKENEERVIYFCKYGKNSKTDEKKFFLMPYYGLCTNQYDRVAQKIHLSLDNPSKTLLINNNLLVGVQKKCITLYQIDQGKLFLKDYDSIGIGNKLVLVELSHIHYKGKDYLLIYGNQKQDIKPFFKCLVYQILNMRLKFIKKVSLLNKQIYKPIILYDNYPAHHHKDEQFCLVVGGYEDHTLHQFNFGALQIHLHLLLSQWLSYPMESTRQVPFTHKQIISSGKAIKIGKNIVQNQSWLLFCTQYQTVSQLHLKFNNESLQSQFTLQQIAIQSKRLTIRDQKIKDSNPQQLFYGENNIYLLPVPEHHHQHKMSIPYRIYWGDKKMEKIRSRPLRELLALFTNK